MALSQSPALRPHLLVVDDDDRLRELLRRYLSEQGLIVSTASNAVEARDLFQNLSCDLIVLDVMMPGETGINLIKSMKNSKRSAHRNLPVLLLTAKGESEDRIEGLESGADDYLPKPFEPRELLLRINAILRRSKKVIEKKSIIKLGKLIYDSAREELQNENGETLRLTDMEAGLMNVLAVEAGAVVGRELLAESSKSTVNDRTIDVQITRLRRKIEEDAKNPRYLITVRGEGYMLLPDIE
jgi:two-component system, OmpR family, phosphate regulon response regulator OmpR